MVIAIIKIYYKTGMNTAQYPVQCFDYLHHYDNNKLHYQLYNNSYKYITIEPTTRIIIITIKREGRSKKMVC